MSVFSKSPAKENPMPIQRCSVDGKQGWKYGDSGRCYTGPGAKKKAIRQGLAIQYNNGPSFESRKSKSEQELDRMAAASISRIEELTDDIRRALMDARQEKTGRELANPET
jgi:hypothetical protein